MRESTGWEREIKSRGWGRERVGVGGQSGRGRVRERRMGVHVCERERVWNGRGGRQSSLREGDGRGIGRGRERVGDRRECENVRESRG